MNLNYKDIGKYLKEAPIISDCSLQDIARLIPHAVAKTLKENEILFLAGTPATELYLIEQGSINLNTTDQGVIELSNSFLGEEVAIGIEYYLSDAIATAPTVVIAIPQEAINKLISANSHIKSKFYFSLLNHYSQTPITYKQSKSSKKKSKNISLQKSLGWLLTILIPALVLFASQQTGLDWNSQMFLTILFATLTMWVMGLVPEFIPGIFSILALLILGVAPTETILSGFASGSFFMALSLFGIGEVLVASGLTYRLVLLISKYVPKSQFWYAFSIFMTGLFLTPIIPSANGRIRLISPLLADMIESLNFRHYGKAATHLSFAAFSGASLLSYVFLSSKSANFVVFGLLPSQVKQEFTWGYWLVAGAAAGILSLLLYVTISIGFFRNQEKPNLSQEHVEAQLKILGAMTSTEWTALLSILLFFIGITTASIHHIELPWIGLGILYIILALEVIRKKEFQTQIDWPFLVLLGSLVGLSNAMSYVGLDQAIGSHLAWMGVFMTGNFSLFILLLSLSIFAVRLVIPNTTTVAIFSTIFIPLAEVNGINPWIIGFIILNVSDAWAMPYQCSYYLQFIEETKHNYDSKLMLQSNMLTNIIRIIAIYISIPYWRLLGIL